ncbi:amidotransferase 1, exosortase A system-associated [candidate division KSB1 bacterium]|nr:amidotransferase 1, exosortase A system-associated [candidate division KSB1 bacterium]RQW10690.1 MAG: amidotransferase 1, exosortase A system-associated [candidate division KSB1 bacterium]
MCGICGQFNYHSQAPVEMTIIKKMTDSLIHRGPDAEGLHIAGRIGLGHRRLKIIDLAGGVQPMFSEDRSLAVVFNGEIYNYLQLKKELASCGHDFRTNSDTEVLLHGYEQWGGDLVHHLRGMFAFAVWDGRKSELFVARDRLGIKPLYYYLDDSTFLFASEIKSILLHPAVDRTIDYQALDDYLTYLYIPAPKSIFKKIRKLAAGHYLRIDARGMKESEYWDISFAPTKMGQRDMMDGIVEQMKDAVRARMISDVPLGAFLSGGIDSSAVVGIMAGLANQPINTASIGFNESAFDELPHARQVAQIYKTNMHEKIVHPDAAKIIDDLAWYFDEPFADSSMVPTYYVSQVAREKVTVCLSGDGGDENFAGYRRYRFDHFENQIRALLPHPVRRPLFSTLGHLYPKADWLPRIFRAKTLFVNLSLSGEQAYYNSMSWFKSAMKSSLYTEPLKKELADYDSFSVFQTYFDRSRGWDALARIQYVDIKTYLVDDILTKVDRASMAHALEVRVPLLDHHFMEYAASLPSDVKLRAGEGKYIMKKALRGIVPDDILYRPKQGFSIPLAKWLRTSLRPLFEANVLASDSFAASLFNMPQVRLLWNQHQRGTRDYGSHLWALLMLESWAKKFLR